MAAKEAIALLLDVGRGMSQAVVGAETPLQLAQNAIKSIIQRKLFAESKDELTLVLVGTDMTANRLAADNPGQYANISVPSGDGVRLADWDLVEYVENEIHASDLEMDILDGLVVALDCLVTGTEGKKFSERRVIMFSNLAGDFSADQEDTIVEGMKSQGIHLNLIGISNDLEVGPDGKEITEQQKRGLTFFNDVLEGGVEGEMYKFSEVMPMLSKFQSRSVMQRAWNCDFDIGELKIPISAFTQVKEAKPKTWKTCLAEDVNQEPVRSRSYHLSDEAETEVDEENTVKGYRYGRTLVPFSDDDIKEMKYTADEKCFSMIGFTKAEKVKRLYFVGDQTLVIVARKGDDSAAVALSAFIQAMVETGNYCIVRYAYRRAVMPKMGVLIPCIKHNVEYLKFVFLPYMEDMRRFIFPSFPAIEESSEWSEKRAAIDELISAMDLGGSAGDDEEEDADEMLNSHEIFNPYFQRLFQCLTHRALRPDEPLPELTSELRNCFQVTQLDNEKVAAAVQKVQENFKLEKVVKKKVEESGESMFKMEEDDNSGAPSHKRAKLDLSAGVSMEDLDKKQIFEVGSITPEDDFRAMISNKEVDLFNVACDGISKRIRESVLESFGSQSYSKALSCMRAFREACVTNQEFSDFNNFLNDFKTSVFDKSRDDFWNLLAAAGLSLIVKDEVDGAVVEKVEAEEFLKVLKEEKLSESLQGEVQAAADLLDDW